MDLQLDQKPESSCRKERNMSVYNDWMNEKARLQHVESRGAEASLLHSGVTWGRHSGGGASLVLHQHLCRCCAVT